MDAQTLAGRAERTSDVEPYGDLSETFHLLQVNRGSDTTDEFRLAKLIKRIRGYERTHNQISAKLDRANREVDENDPSDEPAVLIEVTTKCDDEMHGQHLFENLDGFLVGLTEERLALLREVRRIGPLKPESLARRLDRDIDGLLGDVRGLAFLGLIDETRHGLRVGYDEMIVAGRLEE